MPTRAAEVVRREAVRKASCVVCLLLGWMEELRIHRTVSGDSVFLSSIPRVPKAATVQPWSTHKYHVLRQTLRNCRLSGSETTLELHRW